MVSSNVCRGCLRRGMKKKGGKGYEGRRSENRGGSVNGKKQGSKDRRRH